MEQRLQKLLAAAGVASRRGAEQLIASGRVTVDGCVVTKLGTRVDPETSKVAVDGETVDLRPARVYVMLNKPRGYVSTRRDPHAPRVVLELVKEAGVPLYPVGRLDADTEGLLILTNDGDFAFKMTHPRHKVPKAYRAEVKGLMGPEEINRLATGVELEDGLTAPAEVRLVGTNTERRTSLVELVITEGRKRQVRRMLAAVGHPVIQLSRTRIGNLEIGKLRPGEWRSLTPEEVESLLALAY